LVFLRTPAAVDQGARQGVRTVIVLVGHAVAVAIYQRYFLGFHHRAFDDPRAERGDQADRQTNIAHAAVFGVVIIIVDVAGFGAHAQAALGERAGHGADTDVAV